MNISIALFYFLSTVDPERLKTFAQFYNKPILCCQPELHKCTHISDGFGTIALRKEKEGIIMITQVCSIMELELRFLVGSKNKLVLRARLDLLICLFWTLVPFHVNSSEHAIL